MLSLEPVKAAQKTVRVLISLGVLGCYERFVSYAVGEGSVQILCHNVLQMKEMLHIQMVWPYVEDLVK